MMTFARFTERVDAVMTKEAEMVKRFRDAVDNTIIAKAPSMVIVYIEDDPDHVSLFKTIIAKFSKLTVIPAFNVDGGKRLLEKKGGRVKCVVMDLSLDPLKTDGGVTEGLDLLAWIKRVYPKLPVMILTGHVELTAHIRDRYPDVEVHVKAQEDVETLAKSIEAVAGVA